MKANGSLLRGLVTAMLLCSMAVSASAAGAVLVINQDGSYQVMVDGPGGRSVLVDVAQVVDKRTGSPPIVVPPTNPPTAGDPIATQVKAWSESVGDPATAQGLALIYKTVGERMGSAPRESVMAALKQGTDDWLGNRNAGDKWKEWRKNVSSLITQEEAKGPINWSKFCASVASGLEQSAPNTAIPPELRDLLLKMIQLIITQLLTGGFGDWFGGGGGTGGV